MFDITRLTELVGGVVGQNVGEGGLEALSQKLSDLGIDTGSLDGLANHELLNLINEHGLDLSQLDARSLAELAEQSGVELPTTELLEMFSSRLER